MVKVVIPLPNSTRHWLDYVMFAIRAVWGAMGIATLYRDGSPALLFWAGAAGYVLSCCLPLALFRRADISRLVPPAAELLLTGGLFLLLGAKPDAVFPFFQVPFLTLGYLCAGRQLAWAAPAACAVPFILIGGLPAAQDKPLADSFANWLVLIGIGFCFRKLVSSYQRINGMYGIIRKQKATLEVYARQIEELTLAEERNRLSRELHDTVGHTFTASIVGLDAVYCLIDRHPEEAKSSLRELLALMRGGLDEVRRHIHAIAPEREERSLSLTLRRIGGEFGIHTGMKVSLTVEGEEYQLADPVRLTFIRCLQESLTNARKHGMAGEARIALAFREDEVILAIQDNGTGTDAPVKGFGLQAMTDRLAALNGALDIATSAGGGMTVTCRVPVMPQRAGNTVKEGA